MYHLKIPLEMLMDVISAHFLPWLPQCLFIKCIYTIYSHTFQKLYNKVGHTVVASCPVYDWFWMKEHLIVYTLVLSATQETEGSC